MVIGLQGAGKST